MITLIVFSVITILVTIPVGNWILYQKLLKQLTFINKMVDQNKRQIDIAERQVDMEEQHIEIGNQSLVRLEMLAKKMDAVFLEFDEMKNDIKFLRSITDEANRDKINN